MPYLRDNDGVTVIELLTFSYSLHVSDEQSKKSETMNENVNDVLHHLNLFND